MKLFLSLVEKPANKLFSKNHCNLKHKALELVIVEKFHTASVVHDGELTDHPSTVPLVGFPTRDETPGLLTRWAK